MKETPPVRVRFGAFELDLKAGELRLVAASEGEGRSLLQGQPFRLLVMLLEREGEVATREEIRKQFWPNDTIVEFDHSINAAIGKLRKALGDPANEPKYIETLGRRGYRLMVPVEWIDAGECFIRREDSNSAEGAPSAGTQVDSANLIGRKVSHYRVLEVIGAGGMGLVYKAEDLKLGRRVALKFLPEEVASDAVTLQRFEREAQTASSLNHPNICTIHEVEEHEGQPFIVMELLEGETLRDHLATAATKAVPLDRLLDIAIQICDGLQAAHQKGIIHRDIKPANIFLTTQGAVKILDFGLAKLTVEAPDFSPAEADGEVIRLQPRPGLTSGAQDEPRSDAGTRLIPLAGVPPDVTITRPGAAMGTAGYMSPEQVRGEKLDARTDLFSFGLVLYEMATGQRAFSGETAAIVQEAILNNPPLPLRELNSTLPATLVSLIDKALGKEREQRYPNAAEMLADLESVDAVKHSSTRLGWKWFAAAAVLIALAVVAGTAYWRSRNAIKLTDADTVVLADFSNQTSDPVFDDALNRPLRVELEQTPFLNVLGPDKVRGTLKQMSHAENENLTPALARDVCLHTNSKAVVQGTISDVGNRYGIELTAVDCRTEKTLAQTELEANDRNQVVRTLGVAGNQLRQKLGEPKSSLQKFNQPLDTATSSSLEALQAFAQGWGPSMEKGPAAGIPFYQRAVDLDANFADAYCYLGVAQADLLQTKPATQNLKRAYDLRGGVTLRQRYLIESSYQGDALGDTEKGVQILTEALDSYPRDSSIHNNLGVGLITLGKYEQAAAQLREAVRLEPTLSPAMTNLTTVDPALNRLEEAKAVYRATQSQGVDSPTLRVNRYLIAFLEGDKATMAEQLKWAMGKPGFEDQLLGQQADTEAFSGHVETAREFSQRATESAKRAGMPENAALWIADEAGREAMIGKADRARKKTEEGLQLSRSKFVTPFFGLALALAGDVAQAQSIADKLNQENPLDTMIQNYWLPTIQAALELQKNNSGKAIEILQRAVAYETGNGGGCHSPNYVRGLAYLQAARGQQAASEFQKVIDHPELVGNCLVGALSRLQLARAQAMMGDTDAARKSYQDFLTLWKDADPDIPIYRQARAEYAKLQ